ncbi:hypothetical protein [Parvularcula sp. IMCC14364]|uniref:hypothetical protein n=1 Tax=Parvularcula sp. IMCC14364 TaxID=3067902 RepID=UPI002740AD11|nr:hypothetical protein [Parvularcula sp. IMCC14364]
MFVGHYGPALAGKAVAKSVKLWHLFLAVQIVDVFWAIFIMVGIEQARIVPGFLEASHLDLYHMPYTHSLVATLVWMLAGFLFYRFVRPGAGLLGAVIIALAIGSHWLTDLVVHTRDLPLLIDGPKVGFGLWESLLWSQVVEVGLLLLGLWLYLRATSPKSLLGRFSPWLLFGFLLLLQAYNHLAPPPMDILAMAPMALLSYLLLAGAAALTDATRDNG